MEYMFLPYRRYFDFSGRSSRTELWLFVLFSFTFTLIVLILGGSFDALFFEGEGRSIDWASLGPMFLILVGFFVVSFIPIQALYVRRYHDVGLSGWVYVGLIVVGFFPIIGLLAGLANLVICLLPSIPHDNRWGENPHGESAGFYENEGISQANGARGVRLR